MREPCLAPFETLRAAYAPDTGAGGADGSAAGAAGGSARDGRPRFDAPVPAGGYAWWHIEALSDDGAQGITIIALVGSVFSPFYAWSRRYARAMRRTTAR